MAFKYHKPTRSKCEVCEHLDKTLKEQPIISTFDGKASSANNFPFHNWYNFVLGYVPDFPLYIINKYKVNSTHTILDPFMGTATTNVVAKSLCIPSYGVEANDYFIGEKNKKITYDINNELQKELNAKSDAVIEKLLNKKDPLYVSLYDKIVGVALQEERYIVQE